MSDVVGAIAPIKRSKHRPAPDARTGLEASAEYLRKKRLGGNNPNSLRKIGRAHRIADGDRPFCYGVLTQPEEIDRYKAALKEAEDEARDLAALRSSMARR